MSLRQGFLFALALCALSASARAQEPEGAPEPATAPSAPDSSADRPAPSSPVGTLKDEPEPAPPSDKSVHEPAPPSPPPAKGPLPSWWQGWQTEVHGYFRAPISMSIAPRHPPDDPTGPRTRQVSYGPNRTLDSSYFSFAYTRLQEQDWAEVFIHEKHKHAEAVVGWMGYWLQSVGFRNPDAALAPGMAYLTFDTDFDVADVKPNVALTLGAWWPAFGAFPKYDTYTLGRYRQIGEQLKLTAPLGHRLTLDLYEGFGTGRDGTYNVLAPPFYGSIVGLDLLTWAHAHIAYDKYFDAGIHYSKQWTADSNLVSTSMAGPKSFEAAEHAHVTVFGGEMNLRIPHAGHLWVSPSLIKLRNPWALANSGIEIMHSLAGAGLATNYMGWTNSPSDSTGSGSLFNLGFLYEISLSTIRGKEWGTLLPDFTVSFFGLMTNAKMDLPPTTTLTQSRLKQAKYGMDATLYPLSWLGVMVRGDSVNYDLDHPGYVFAALSSRLILSTHFVLSESMYLQYSHYFYGDNMKLNGTWPWGAPLVAGSNVLQQGPYSGQKPDQDVIKLQAEVTF